MPLVYSDEAVAVLKALSQHYNHYNEGHVEVHNLISEFIAATMFNAMQSDHSELLYKATHDGLTGLANRGLFYDRLRTTLGSDNINERCLGVMILDMDNLKEINDCHGHRTGDAALKETARRVQACIGEVDTGARIGGDEFGIIAPGVKGHEDLEALALKLEREIERPFTFEGTALHLGASIGWTLARGNR